MIFNTKKCKTLHIGPGEPRNYFMTDKDGGEHLVQKVDKEKDLGVVFDKKMLFNEHINTKVNLANRNLGLIAKNFTYMNKEMFLHLYKSLVRPHLEYCLQSWCRG